MFRYLFWANGKPSGFAYVYTATLVMAAVLGTLDGPQISADIEAQWAAQQRWEQGRLITQPAARQPSPCAIDPASSPWCFMGRFVIPN